MAALSSDFDSRTSNAVKDEALGNSECASDDEFVHIQLTSSQKDSAMASLSTIFQSEKAIVSCTYADEDESISRKYQMLCTSQKPLKVSRRIRAEGDWVALSSPAMKVEALEVSNSPPGPSEENPANTVARDFEVCRTLRYRNLKTTSTDPAPDIDPTKRETYLSEEEFGSLFGMSKSQFYTLPKWKQAQRKLDLDLF